MKGTTIRRGGAAALLLLLVAAGAGAQMLLVNRNLRHVATDVARGVEHVELSQRRDFQDRFAEAMGFPRA